MYFDNLAPRTKLNLVRLLDVIVTRAIHWFQIHCLKSENGNLSSSLITMEFADEVEGIAAFQIIPLPIAFEFQTALILSQMVYIAGFAFVPVCIVKRCRVGPFPGACIGQVICPYPQG